MHTVFLELESNEKISNEMICKWNISSCLLLVVRKKTLNVQRYQSDTPYIEFCHVVILKKTEYDIYSVFI